MSDFSEIRHTLETRLRQLDRRMTRIEGDLRRPGNRDSEEMALESENDEVLERLGESETQELEAIRGALARLEAGSYGRCERCGEPIDARRLRAMPTATACIDCAD